MRRRDFLGVLGSAVTAWPVAARAQQPAGRVRRIAILTGGAEADPEQPRRIAVFQQALRGFGWSDGSNITLDVRYAGGEVARMRSLAREMIEHNPAIILAATTPVVAAFREHTSTIPIVFVVVSDPVGSGFVASLARPGGNVTGFINIEASLGGKWIELLKEVAPHVKRVTMMFNPDSAPQSDYYLPTFEAAARSFGVESSTVRVRSEAEIEQAIAALGREPGGGLVVMPDIFVAVHRRIIISQSSRHHVPAVYPFRFFVTDGGLISYGMDVADSYLRAAYYVHRIFGGEKPADLPVQVPTKFELAVNLKTAKALGLAVPPTLLGRADEVIE